MTDSNNHIFGYTTPTPLRLAVMTYRQDVVFFSGDDEASRTYYVAETTGTDTGRAYRVVAMRNDDPRRPSTHVYGVRERNAAFARSWGLDPAEHFVLVTGNEVERWLDEEPAPAPVTTLPFGKAVLPARLAHHTLRDRSDEERTFYCATMDGMYVFFAHGSDPRSSRFHSVASNNAERLLRNAGLTDEQMKGWRTWAIRDDASDVEIVDEPAPAEVSEPSDTCSYCGSSLVGEDCPNYLLAAAEKRMAIAEERHRRDIASIGERLIEEANSRDWCEEYDEIVDSLNASLYESLPLRTRTARVRVDVGIYVDVEVTHDQDAEDKATAVVRDLLRKADAAISSYEVYSSDELD